MSSELSRLYRALAAEVTDTALAAPDAVRRRADRNARMQMAVTTAAAAVLVAGTAVGVPAVLTGDGSPPPPEVGTTTTPATGRPSPTGSPSPTGGATSPPTATGTPSTTTPRPGRSSSAPTAPAVPAPPPAPTSIPDRAFFEQPANTKKDEPRFLGSENMLPELCAATYPADRSLLTRRTRHLIYKLPSSPADPSYVPDGSFDHTITSYPNGVAATWMAELRTAVENCRTQTISGFTYRQRLVAGTRYGDESMLIEVSTPNRDVNGNPTGGDEIRLVSVVRVGNVVTVLYEQGWEGTSSDRALVDDFTRRAVSAVRAWLG
jgi:hypothetical protein